MAFCITFIFRSAMCWASITAGLTITLWLQRHRQWQRIGLLQSVMELAGFHVTSSDDGSLSRADIKLTERLGVGPLPRNMWRTIYGNYFRLKLNVFSILKLCQLCRHSREFSWIDTCEGTYCSGEAGSSIFVLHLLLAQLQPQPPRVWVQYLLMEIPESSALK